MLDPSSPDVGILDDQGFRVAVHPDRGQVVVAPSGELDLATAERLGREITDLRDVGFGDIVVDLRGVTFIDSTGLRTLLGQARIAGERGQRFRLVGACASVRRLFEITGTTSVFDFVERTPR